MDNQSPRDEDLVNVSEAAELTGLTAKALRRRLERGTIRAVKRSGRRMIPISELERHNLLAATNGDLAEGASEAGSTPFPSLARAQAAAPVGAAGAPTPNPGEAAPPAGQPVSPPVQAPQQPPAAPATPQPGVPPAAPVVPPAAPQQVPPAAAPGVPAPAAPAPFAPAPAVPGQVAPAAPQTAPVAGAPAAVAAQPIAAAVPAVAPAPASPVPPAPTGLRYYWDEHPFWRAAAIIVGLAIIGLLVWLLLLRDNSSTVTVVPGGPPVIYTSEQLTAFSEDIGQPIYWAGPISATRLEVTETTSQLVFLRYLTGAALAGDPSTQFVTVGTYPVVNGYSALKDWARHQHAATRRVPSGGIAVSVPGSPTSVFFAEPTRPVQVEVYNPQPGQALHMVLAGQVRPVAPGVQGVTSSQAVVPGAGTVTPGATVAPSSTTQTVVPSG